LQTFKIQKISQKIDKNCELHETWKTVKFGKNITKKQNDKVGW